MNKINLHTINRLLPQTQCRECGYDGCEPYAAALVAGEAAVNLCAPGGEIVMRDLAALLRRPPQAPAKTQTPALALIDENVCIGCAACIRVCPVDAIMGATKQMHTVLADECTGCGLCVPSCPVDCIEMVGTEDACLPRHRFLGTHETEARFQAAAHAQSRYQNRNARRAAAKKPKPNPNQTSATPAVPNAAALIAQAMARAQNQAASAPANREQFRQRRLAEEREKAAFRRAQRDVQYGNEQEKAAALAWLRERKSETSS
ncbi:RnfABCDGE type electron transport complex subunit B [Conchiformibius kuhniae]|uniref:RnfABCDGE type electron transport complex subunit B n=1 Tax=Conchiformibius kuhniae TaxID=211502 RepID=A0A8T9MVK0_9NEIS|nr:RnfABCDGE type electron transport complex subunit B [Conchiformibius kuhniae]UOP04172.1 RnfABCDGE type electron transport complex subunit B [Conchiformibius kuhniae]